MGARENKLIKTRLASLDNSERLFRANSGMGWVAPPGRVLTVNRTMTVKVNKGDVILRGAMPFHGMPAGTPDLIGWKSITITSEMVGQVVAIFIAEEVKATGTLSAGQNKFGKLLEKMGGVFRVITP